MKKVEYDNKTGEILTASSILDIDEDRILEEEALDGYYVLVTSEMEESDDKIIMRILEMKLENKYSSGRIIESLSKAECDLLQQNYYYFVYYDEVLKDIGKVTGIDFSKKIRTLGDIKQELANTKKK